MNAALCIVQTFISFINRNPSLFVFRSSNFLSHYPVIFMLSFLGIWNLDFFRYVIPPFCIGKSLTLLQSTALEYVLMLYPASRNSKCPSYKLYSLVHPPHICRLIARLLWKWNRACMVLMIVNGFLRCIIIIRLLLMLIGALYNLYCVFCYDPDHTDNPDDNDSTL